MFRPAVTALPRTMHLDMQTMSAVNVTVTAILGGVLLFIWARERDSAFVGWWGLALVIMSAGVILSSFPWGRTPTAPSRLGHDRTLRRA